MLIGVSALFRQAHIPVCKLYLWMVATFLHLGWWNMLKAFHEWDKPQWKTGFPDFAGPFCCIVVMFSQQTHWVFPWIKKQVEPEIHPGCHWMFTFSQRMGLLFFTNKDGIGSTGSCEARNHSRRDLSFGLVQRQEFIATKATKATPVQSQSSPSTTEIL